MDPVPHLGSKVELTLLMKVPVWDRQLSQLLMDQVEAWGGERNASPSHQGTSTPLDFRRAGPEVIGAGVLFLLPTSSNTPESRSSTLPGQYNRTDPIVIGVGKQALKLLV